MSDGADDEEQRRQEIIDSYKVVCICNKIRRGVDPEGDRRRRPHDRRRPPTHARRDRSLWVETLRTGDRGNARAAG